MEFITKEDIELLTKLYREEVSHFIASVEELHKRISYLENEVDKLDKDIDRLNKTISYLENYNRSLIQKLYGE